LRQLPLFKRKQILRRIVPTQPAPVLYADHFDQKGVDLFRAVCEMDLEGIVAKRKDGMYTPTETTWVKIKNPRYLTSVLRVTRIKRPPPAFRTARDHPDWKA